MSTEEKVFIGGGFGNICGILHKVDETSEIVIIVHEFSSNKDKSSKHTARNLSEIGLNSIRIDLDNQGESDLDFETGACVPNYLKQVESTIDYVKNLGYKEISLVGTSYGGLVVFATALSHPEIKKMVLRVPVVDYKKHSEWKWGKEKLEKWKHDGFVTLEELGSNRVNYGFIEKSYPYSMFDNCSNIKSPVLFIVGDSDPHVDYNVAKEVTPKFPNAKIHVIAGADHLLRVGENDFTEGNQTLINFFKE